ncbi:MAG: VOC family protein [Opitutae bacterium]|nr:VOC family protein [Opitutae bacterium]
MSNPTPKTAVPIIGVESVEEIRRFYIGSLGFEHVRGVIGQDGRFEICALAMDGARLMFARTQGTGPSAKTAVTKQPVTIYIEVADVDRYFSLLGKKHGVNVTERVATQWWGVRSFKVMDPHGYEIWFYQVVGEPKPPAGTKLV